MLLDSVKLPASSRGSRWLFASSPMLDECRPSFETQIIRKRPRYSGYSHRGLVHFRKKFLSRSWTGARCPISSQRPSQHPIHFLMTIHDQQFSIYRQWHQGRHDICWSELDRYLSPLDRRDFDVASFSMDTVYDRANRFRRRQGSSSNSCHRLEAIIIVNPDRSPCDKF